MTASRDSLHQPHDHELQYLLKGDNDGHFVARVLQIPEIVAQGISPEIVEKKLEKAALSYLRAYEDEHLRIMSDNSSRLTDSGNGTIIKTGTIRVYC